jgi:hypothetical protein
VNRTPGFDARNALANFGKTVVRLAAPKTVSLPLLFTQRNWFTPTVFSEPALVQVGRLFAPTGALTTRKAPSVARVDRTVIVLRGFGISKNLAPQTSRKYPKNSVFA